MADVVVRRARPEEYDAVGALTAQAYLDDGTVSEDYAAVLRDAAGRAGATELMVAVDADGSLVGSVTLVPPDAPREWRQTAVPGAPMMRMLAVPVEHRGRGIGRLLTQWCLDYTASNGWHSLCLHTQETMPAAQSLYASMGFVRDESLDVDVTPTVHLIGYRIAVRPPDRAAAARP